MGELLVRLTIRAAMCAWTIGILTKPRISRWAWTAGFFAYVIHIIVSFDTFYGWSQKVALEETARQTYQLTGWNSDIGLWVNYAFTAFLAFDLWNQWTGKPERLRKTRNGLVIFMILNGAVIFGTFPSRILGTGLLGGMLLYRVRRKRRRVTHNN